MSETLSKPQQSAHGNKPTGCGNAPAARWPMSEQIARARAAIAREIQGRPCSALRTMPCPNCHEGILFYGVRRNGSVSATCSCQGGIIIDDISLEQAMARAAEQNAIESRDWLSKSLPPEPEDK